MVTDLPLGALSLSHEQSTLPNAHEVLALTTRALMQLFMDLNMLPLDFQVPVLHPNWVAVNIPIAKKMSNKLKNQQLFFNPQAN